MNVENANRVCFRNQRMTLTPDWKKVGLDKRSKSVFQRTRESVDETTSEDHPGKFEFDRPIQHFLTGSSYEGSWNSLGFSGYGSYFFPHGAIYNGNFKNGQFHGKGVITYPVGHKLKCVHKNGRLIKKLFVFDDGLEVHHPNNYCLVPDRRFQVEFNTSLRGAGGEFLTNRQPTIEIPEGCFDTIDGFYSPSVKCVYKYDEEALKMGIRPIHKCATDTLKRTIRVEESKFIEKFYRKSHVNHLGYRPDLYEFWMTGRKSEVEEAIAELGLQDQEAKRRESLKSDDSSSMMINLEFEMLKTTY